MASNPVGTMYVELSLDATKYTAAQKAILAGAEQNSADINKVFATVGTKSDEMYNAMRNNIQNALNAIKQSHISSADEIRRAEESAAGKITAINTAQFGAHTSLLDGLKSNYVAASVAIVAAWALVNKAVGMMDEGAKALQVESSFKIMAESAGINSEKMIASMKAATRETIDDSDLMQKAVKLMTLGYDSSQIERFSAVVITASQIAGTTAVEAFDALGDAIANRMPKALVKMGGVTKEQMTVVNEAITAGASSTVLFELAMANLELKQKMLMGTQDEATISLQRFHAQVSETKETIGKGLIIAVQSLYGVFQSIGGASLTASAGIYKVLQASTALSAMTTFGDTSKAFKAASEGYRAAAESDFAAADKLTKQGIANITGQAEAGKKATVQELADGKAKVASLMKELSTFKSTKDGEKKAIEAAAAAAKKAAEEAKKNDIEGAELISKLSLEQIKIYEKDLKFFEDMEKDKATALEKEMESWRKAGETAVGEMEKEIARGVDLSKATIDRTEKRGEAEREIYKDLRGYEDQYYAASAGLIAAQAQKYKDLGVSEVAVAAWVAAETEKNDIKKAKSGDDFMAGVKAGYTEMQNNAMTFGKAGYEIFNTFSRSSETAISDILFQSFKTGTFDAQAIWTTFTDSMLKKLTDVMAQMAVEAAANTISMLFKATVSGDWTQILGLINKGWDLWNSFDSGGGGNIDSLGSIDLGGGIEGRAGGGPVGGKPVWVGEKGAELLFPGGPGYVMEHNQSQVYAARNGGFIPGYAVGGLVETTQPTPPVDTWTGKLGEYPCPNRPTSRLDPLYASLNVSTNDNGFSSLHGWSLYDGWNGRAGQLYLDKQEAETGVVSPKYTVTEEQIGEKLNRLYYYDGTTAETEISMGMGWWQTFLEKYGAQLTMTLAAAAITYGVGSAVGAAAGSAAGTAAGAGAGGLTGYMSGKGSWQSAIIGAIGGAVGGYSAGGASSSGEILADMAGTAEYNAVIGGGGTIADAGAAYDVAFQSSLLSSGIDSVLNFAEKYATKYLTKWAVGEVVGALGNAMGGDKGGNSLSFTGVSGDLTGLADLMGQIAPKESSLSFPLFSAKDGLDYVPYDNFPARLHKGERVLTKEENKGGGEITIHSHIYLDGKEIQTVVAKGFKTNSDLIQSARRAVN